MRFFVVFTFVVFLACFLREAKGGEASENDLFAHHEKDKKYLESVVERAANGNVEAQLKAGKLYRVCSSCAFGPGYTCDTEEGNKWLRKAAENGSIEAHRLLGYAYSHSFSKEKNLSEAIKWFSIAAERGDAQSQAGLGWIYTSDKEGRQDYSEALKWYSLAAEQGHAPAVRSLAEMYAKGWGVDQDILKAREILLKSAKDDAPAQYHLALLYMEDPKNYEEAYFWTSLVRARRSMLGHNDPALDEPIKHLSPQQKAAVENRVHTWLTKSE